MKKSELKDLSKKSAQEITKTVQDLRADLTNLLIEQSTGKLKDLHKIQIKKRSIAQMLTLLKIKLLESGKNMKAENNKEVNDGKK